MKKHAILIIFIFLIFLSCQNKVKYLNLITDDLKIINVVNKFNSENKKIKIFMHYYNNEDNIDLYEYIIKNKISDYDLIIGEYFPHNIINSKHFYKIDKNSKSAANKTDLYYNAVNNFNLLHNNYLLIYSINFPLIVFKDNKYLKEYNDTYMNIEDFINISKKLNYKNFDGKIDKIKLGFSPKFSSLDDIEYLFLFNSQIEYLSNKKINLDNIHAKYAYNFYFNYDNDYNYGIDVTEKYIKKYNNIKKSNFLQNDIIYSDFIHFSNIFHYTSKNYKYYLLNKLKYISLIQNTASIHKKSKHKHESVIFIEYLLSPDIQLLLSKSSFNENNYFFKNHFPIQKNILNQIKYLPFESKKLNNYIKNMTYPNFINNNIQNKFFEKYFITQEKLNNGLITEKEFLDYLNKELNN